MRTVLIPSAGTGSRLGSFTADVNKGQMSIGDKPVISYIIEKFTAADKIIICLGYKGDLLKQVIKACYPNWNIQFVEVDKFEGEGSGPGYSIIKARDLIREPFYFFCNDGIIDDDIFQIPTFSNTILGYPCNVVTNPEAYRNLKVIDGKVVEVLPKGEATLYSYPYIGIAYIKDWEDFFGAYDKNPELFINAGEAVGLNNLKNCDFYLCPSWCDTGNIKDLEIAKKKFSKSGRAILEKPDEAIWFFDDKVVKFHVDSNFIKDRVHRWLNIERRSNNNFITPKLISHSENVYTYKFVDGKVMSEICDISIFKNLVNSYLEGITSDVYIGEEESKAGYIDFYLNKTLDRIQQYLVKFEDKDEACIINGVTCKEARKILQSIDWAQLSKKAIWSKNFHGDFQMENIICVDDSKFALIDFRQNFGKMGSIGDIYYDIGKLWHSFYINDHIIKEGLYSIDCIGDNIYNLDIHRPFIYTEYENVMIEILEQHNIDIKLSELIMCIVILSFAALHTSPYSRFAFYMGKYLLNRWHNIYNN